MVTMKEELKIIMKKMQSLMQLHLENKKKHEEKEAKAGKEPNFLSPLKPQGSARRDESSTSLNRSALSARNGLQK